MNSERTIQEMIQRFAKDLVDQVFEEEFGPTIKAGIDERTKTLKEYIRQMIREEIAERTILC